MERKTIPWVEKYRPNNFNDIVLDHWNKTILNNILHTEFPNILFYGPPGTGKTTTIINLIKEYQTIHKQKGKELIIHLNASDDRGIEVIRNQIYSFVNSNTLFGSGMKFIILDEVDYMTKNAQVALKEMISLNKQGVRFCLICNYIHRIEKSLQDDFILFRFNQLPKDKITQFLITILTNENIHIEHSVLEKIQEYFNSDIRSMINYIQSNQTSLNHLSLINNDVLTNIYNKILHASYNDYEEYIYIISKTYKIHRYELFKKLCIFLYTHYNIQTLTILDNIRTIQYIPLDIIMKLLYYKVNGSESSCNDK